MKSFFLSFFYRKKTPTMVDISTNTYDHEATERENDIQKQTQITHKYDDNIDLKNLQKSSKKTIYIILRRHRMKKYNICALFKILSIMVLMKNLGMEIPIQHSDIICGSH